MFIIDTSQQESSWFESWFFYVWSFACSPVCVGFSPGPPASPPTVQRHADWGLGWLEARYWPSMWLWVWVGCLCLYVCPMIAWWPVVQGVPCLSPSQLGLSPASPCPLKEKRYKTCTFCVCPKCTKRYFKFKTNFSIWLQTSGSVD